jgi:hypothetical protein
VRAEFCRAGDGSGRAVIVLHGCGGFSTFDHRIVTRLPAYGISTLDVDYFGLTPRSATKGSAAAADEIPTCSVSGRASRSTLGRSSDSCQVCAVLEFWAGRWAAVLLFGLPSQLI